MTADLMTDDQVMQELKDLQGSFTEADFDELEYLLWIKAGCLGWTGDPLKQPARSVLACARQVKKEKESRP